jgi:hypothetical protein
MADKKISALTASATPLAGTEVLPIVQSGATVKVAVSDLTAGRAMSATQLTLTTENLIVGTAGKGIDFSANGGDVLTQYDEGTFTPVFNNLTVGNGSVSGRYTRIGRMVTATIQMEFGSTSAWTGICANISGLPFTSLYRANGLITLFRTGVAWYAGQVMIYANQSQTSFPGDANGAGFSALTPWIWGTGDFVVITLTYEV